MTLALNLRTSYRILFIFLTEVSVYQADSCLQGKHFFASWFDFLLRESKISNFKFSKLRYKVNYTNMISFIFFMTSFIVSFGLELSNTDPFKSVHIFIFMCKQTPTRIRCPFDKSCSRVSSCNNDFASNSPPHISNFADLHISRQCQKPQVARRNNKFDFT